MTLMAILTSIVVLLMLASILPAMMSPMLFDSPSASGNRILRVVFYSLISFPVVCLFSIMVAWVSWGLGFEYSAFLFILPLINIVALAFGVYIIYAAID